MARQAAYDIGVSHDADKALTYGHYLQLDHLLRLQQPLSGDGEGVAAEHDEMLFIVIHQVYELWFKQTLHEVDKLLETLFAGNLHASLAGFNRILTILRVMVAQIDVIETMTPTSFSSFRDRLQSSSGFESHQFRQFEFALGYKRRSAMDHHKPDSIGHAALVRRFEAPTLWDAYLAFLHQHDAPVPAASLTRDVTLPVVQDSALQVVLVALYRSQPLLRLVSERMVDIDEGLQEWRYRHVKMVQRTIGTKAGTGGSSGATYLRSTLFKPLFPDLWAIRVSL